MVLAHTGHTLTTIAYFVPVVAFLVWLVVVQIKDRRGRSDGQDPAGG
jgi:cytochrome c oxidase assembly factor CtaG